MDLLKKYTLLITLAQVPATCFSMEGSGEGTVDLHARPGGRFFPVALQETVEADCPFTPEQIREITKGFSTAQFSSLLAEISAVEAVEMSLPATAASVTDGAETKWDDDVDSDVVTVGEFETDRLGALRKMGKKGRYAFKAALKEEVRIRELRKAQRKTAKAEKNQREKERKMADDAAAAVLSPVRVKAAKDAVVTHSEEAVIHKAAAAGAGFVAKMEEPVTVPKGRAALLEKLHKKTGALKSARTGAAKPASRTTVQTDGLVGLREQGFAALKRMGISRDDPDPVQLAIVSDGRGGVRLDIKKADDKEKTAAYLAAHGKTPEEIEALIKAGFKAPATYTVIKK